MELRTFEKLDFERMPKLFRQNFFNAITGFKSLNLVGTINQNEQTNLAVFSQVLHLGADPALIGILVRPDSVPRHTLSNIESVGFFTLNHVRKEMVKQAHQTAARYATDISEFDAVGLTPVFVDGFRAPFVQEANIRIGLRWVETIPISANQTKLVVGAVQQVILPESAVKTDGFVDVNMAGTITVSGLDAYYTTQKLVRFSYAKPSVPLIEIPF